MNRTRDALIWKLIEKLGDRDPRVRRNAAGALRLHGSRARDAVPTLTALLDDEDPMVRDEARRALDRLRAVAA
jgi:HEAT repeat protein